jgi:chemotaxis protein methyltransferase CheR
VIVEELRRAAEFNRHNLVADEVFMEAQLIVCRNVLIYFNDALQKRALDLFGRSLQRGGYLLVGRSESLAASPAEADMFQALPGEANIYRRISGVRHV